MNANIFEALTELETSWKYFQHKCKKMGKIHVMAVLCHGMVKGYKTTDQFSDEEIDSIISAIDNYDPF